jgi:hypothetical protein
MLVYLTSVSSYMVFIPVVPYIRVAAAASKGELWRTPLLGGAASLDSITDIRRKTSISGDWGTLLLKRNHEIQLWSWRVGDDRHDGLY